MANDIGGNPWVLDTVTAAVLLGTNTLVDHFEFVGYALDTDTATVVDASGRVVWLANGQGDLSNVTSFPIGWIRGGLRLSQLSAGKVYVYICP